MTTPLHRNVIKEYGMSRFVRITDEVHDLEQVIENPVLEFKDDVEVRLHRDGQEILLVTISRDLIAHLFNGFFHVVSSRPQCYWCRDDAEYLVASYNSQSDASFGDTIQVFGCERHKE